MRCRLRPTLLDHGDSGDLRNCVATTVPIVALMSGEYFETPPGCDAVNDEIVWASTTDGANHKIKGHYRPAQT